MKKMDIFPELQLSITNSCSQTAAPITVAARRPRAIGGFFISSTAVCWSCVVVWTWWNICVANFECVCVFTGTITWCAVSAADSGKSCIEQSCGFKKKKEKKSPLQSFTFKCTASTSSLKRENSLCVGAELKTRHLKLKLQVPSNVSGAVADNVSRPIYIWAILPTETVTNSPQRVISDCTPPAEVTRLAMSDIF